MRHNSLPLCNKNLADNKISSSLQDDLLTRRTFSPVSPSGVSWDGRSFSKFLVPGSAPFLISSFTASSWLLWFCRELTMCRAVFPLNVYDNQSADRIRQHATGSLCAPLIELQFTSKHLTLTFTIDSEVGWSSKMLNSSTFASSAAMWRHVRPLFRSCGDEKCHSGVMCFVLTLPAKVLCANVTS